MTAISVRGVGLGLRHQHFAEILSQAPAVPWFEVLVDNFFDDHGMHIDRLMAVRERYPVVLHSVGLNLGGGDPHNETYVGRYLRAVERFRPVWVSDHLCWTAFQGRRHHDLLPLPFTQAVANHVAQNIRRIQDLVGLPFLLENVSSYVTARDSEMPEWEFLMTVVDAADCGILLDVNNVFVSATNHGFSPLAYIAGIDPSRVRQIHVAGHAKVGDVMVDTHGQHVDDAVWVLYREAVRRFGSVPTCVERDSDIPSLQELQREMAIAEAVASEVGQEHGP